MLWLRLLSKQDQNRMQGWSIHIRSFGTTAVNKPTNKPTNKQVNVYTTTKNKYCHVKNPLHNFCTTKNEISLNTIRFFAGFCCVCSDTTSQ